MLLEKQNEKLFVYHVYTFHLYINRIMKLFDFKVEKYMQVVPIAHFRYLNELKKNDQIDCNYRQWVLWIEFSEKLK